MGIRGGRTTDTVVGTQDRVRLRVRNRAGLATQRVAIATLGAAPRAGSSVRVGLQVVVKTTTITPNLEQIDRHPAVIVSLADQRESEQGRIAACIP
jgi:hypothetical protein